MAQVRAEASHRDNIKEANERVRESDDHHVVRSAVTSELSKLRVNAHRVMKNMENDEEEYGEA